MTNERTKGRPRIPHTPTTEGVRLLRAWQESHGLTDIACSERLGIRRDRFSRIMRNIHAPHKELATHIAEVTRGAVPKHSWHVDIE